MPPLLTQSFSFSISDFDIVLFEGKKIADTLFSKIFDIGPKNYMGVS